MPYCECGNKRPIDQKSCKQCKSLEKPKKDKVTETKPINLVTKKIKWKLDSLNWQKNQFKLPGSPKNLK